MKNMNKKNLILITTILIIVIMSFFTTVNANINPDDYSGIGQISREDYEQAFNLTGTILNTIMVIGIVVSIASVIGLGIKYMVGSVEQRAEYKKTMLPMLIGSIFLFASCGIVALIYNLAMEM